MINSYYCASSCVFSKPMWWVVHSLTVFLKPLKIFTEHDFANRTENINGKQRQYCFGHTSRTGTRKSQSKFRVLRHDAHRILHVYSLIGHVANQRAVIVIDRWLLYLCGHRSKNSVARGDSQILRKLIGLSTNCRQTIVLGMKSI